MTVALAPHDFQNLVRIVQTLPEFGSARERRALVAAALEGTPRAASMLARLDFDGTPATVATEVSRFLAGYGQTIPGQEALGIFLDQLLANMGSGEDADFLSDVITRYTLRQPPASANLNLLMQPVPRAGERYVFISYAHVDQTYAAQVEAVLRAAGFRLFWDTANIRGGANWDMSIETALNEVTHMVLLLSASSMPYRKEVYREWFFFDQKGKPILPLYIQTCTLHSRLLAYSYIDARTDLSGALQTLATELMK